MEGNCKEAESPREVHKQVENWKKPSKMSFRGRGGGGRGGRGGGGRGFGGRGGGRGGGFQRVR